MDVHDRSARLERHVLVMGIWFPAVLVAAVALHYGLGAGGPGWVLAAAAIVLTGFVGHVIVNAVLRTDFSPREVALGLVAYGGAVLAVGVGAIAINGFAGRFFLPAASGLAAIAIAVVFYMVTRNGVRRAFENFDVIREFNPRPGSLLLRRRPRR